MVLGLAIASNARAESAEFYEQLANCLKGHPEKSENQCRQELAAAPRAPVQNYLRDPDAEYYASLDRPNAISFELAGQAGLYSFRYDHQFNDLFGLGAGFSSWNASLFFQTYKMSIVPVYAQFFMSPAHNHFYISPGLDFVSVTTSTYDPLADASSDKGLFQSSGSGVLGKIGFGYEHRGNEGFLFRVEPQLLFGRGGAALTIGLDFGYAF